LEETEIEETEGAEDTGFSTEARRNGDDTESLKVGSLGRASGQVSVIAYVATQ
jgi:hypothetical protein